MSSQIPAPPGTPSHETCRRRTRSHPKPCYLDRCGELFTTRRGRNLRSILGLLYSPSHRYLHALGTSGQGRSASTVVSSFVLDATTRQWCGYTVLAIVRAVAQDMDFRSDAPKSSTGPVEDNAGPGSRVALPDLAVSLCVRLPTPGQVVVGGADLAAVDAEEHVSISIEGCFLGWPHRPGITGVVLGQCLAPDRICLSQDYRPGPIETHKYHGQLSR